MRQIKVRNMTVSVFPDHTARTAFNDVRRQLQDIEAVRFGLFCPARLRITYRDQQRDFTSPEEAIKYVEMIKKDAAP